MSGRRPIAGVSLDLDDLWSYLRARGEPSWTDRGSYLPTFIPRVLDALNHLGIGITFFVIGRDAAQPEHRQLFSAIVRHGHDIGNHSFEHEPWLHLYAEERLAAELRTAEEAIEAATGRRPTGFRGPGFSWTPALLELLHSRGYTYDASTLPTFWGPAVRRLYLRASRLTPEQRRERGQLFGSFSDGFRPITPYRWKLSGGGELLEVPVTTVPGIRTPFHLSYILALAGWSERVAFTYLEAALSLCRWSNVAPSFLLHPLDLLGYEDAPQLSFFPGMRLPAARKQRWFARALRMLTHEFAVTDLSSFARTVQHAALPIKPAPSPRPVEARS